jgi:hypothetical protein
VNRGPISEIGIHAGNRPPALNRRWLQQLAYATSVSGDLVVMPEPPLNDAATSGTGG